MFKFAVIACFACACAAPLDTKVDGPKNFTEKSGSDAKTVPSYGDFSRPVSPYSLPAPSRPVYSSPLFRPSMSLPSPYLIDSKTTHLRPQLYQSQPQLYQSQSQLYQSQPQLYQSQPHPYTYSYQSYPQSVYSYSNYQPGYQSYGHGYYRQSKEPEPMQPAPATRIVIQKPQQVDQIPVGMEPQVSGMMPRDVSSLWAPYLPQENFGRRDIADDLQIQPTYLMNRLHVEPSPKSARSAEDYSTDYSPSAEDDLYYVMNKYDQPPVVAKGTIEEAFQQTGDAHVNAIWMPPIFSSPIVPTNLRDSKPYSSESILEAMNQFYAGKYYEQMLKATRNPSARNADQSDDKVLQAVAQEIVNIIKAKKTEPSPPAKPEEPKETSTAAPKTNA